MKRQLNAREKIILIVTVTLFAGVIVYKTFLQGFVEEYRGTSQNLEEMRQKYNKSLDSLKNKNRVDADYEAIAASLNKRKSGKRPDMLFTEEVAGLFRRLEVPTPTIRPATSEPVPGMDGFSYLVLNVEGIAGDLHKITTVLMEFYKQNVLIQKINVKAPPAGGEDNTLTVNVELAQIVRTEELGIDEEKESSSGGETTVGREGHNARRSREAAPEGEDLNAEE